MTAIAKYNFGISVGNDTANEGGFFSLTDGCGMTDDLALALVRALQGLPWPAGSNPHASVTKFVTDTVQSEGDPANNTFVQD